MSLFLHLYSNLLKSINTNERNKLNAVRELNIFFQTMTTEKFFGKPSEPEIPQQILNLFAHICSILLDMSTRELSRDLQLECLTALYNLFAMVNSRMFLFTLFPGISKGLLSIILGDSRSGSRIISSALFLYSEVVCYVFDDGINVEYWNKNQMYNFSSTENPNFKSFLGGNNISKDLLSQQENSITVSSSQLSNTSTNTAQSILPPSDTSPSETNLSISSTFIGSFPSTRIFIPCRSPAFSESVSHLVQQLRSLLSLPISTLRTAHTFAWVLFRLLRHCSRVLHVSSTALHSATETMYSELSLDEKDSFTPNAVSDDETLPVLLFEQLLLCADSTHTH